VRALPLPDAGLSAYRALEQRVAAQAPGWRIELAPPALALPPVTFDGDDPDDGGEAALGLAAWAAQRIGTPLGVSGPDANVAVVIERLQRNNLLVRQVPGPGGAQGAVLLGWQSPAQER
jgi:hypothetical protein